MREGPQSEAGERERSNVVRLPRDWLGPRQDLIPFGPRAAFHDTDEPPPSAEDFWGERSAAVHGALQAPHPPAAVSGPARRPRRRRIRITAAGAQKSAIAALCGIGVASIVIGFTPHDVKITGLQGPDAGGGLRVSEATVLSIGASPLPIGGLPKAPAVTARKTPRVVARHHRRPAAHASRAEVVAKPSHAAAAPVHAATTSYTQSPAGRTYSAPVSTSTGSAAQPTSTPRVETHKSAPAGPVGPGAPFGPGEFG